MFKFIGYFFKFIWRAISLLRVVFSNLAFLLLIGIVYFAYTQTESAPEPVRTESALILNLNGPIVEQRSYASPLQSVSHTFSGKDTPQENVLFDIVETLHRAAKDDYISGLVLALGGLEKTSLTQLRYLGKAIDQFKASGKPVFAVGDFYSQSQYYLASYADKVFLSPDGGILLQGYSANGVYYKKLLDKLDINTHVFRVGTYKSAVEPFIRNSMSPAAKEANQRWLSQLWDAYLNDIAKHREIDPNKVRNAINNFVSQLEATQGNIADIALKLKLVDQLATRPQIRQELRQVFGVKGIDSYRHIDYYDYVKQQSIAPNTTGGDIAIVVASGAIMDGDQPRGTIGGDTLARKLRQALSERAKAVVLRVDSPGGSAFASEVVRNEILELKRRGIPVVVSMSSVAASGGYWISMSADKIIAQPTTITGSIGIFSVITTFEDVLNKYGVSTDGVGTTPFSGQGIMQGLSSDVKRAIQLGIEQGYRRFTSLVADSRQLSLLDVNRVAEGHVWTGKDALELGLVDQLGDFDDAIAEAASLAGVNNYTSYFVEEPIPAAQQFLIEMLSEARVQLGIDFSAMIPKSWLPISQIVSQYGDQLSKFNDPKAIYAQCLTCDVQ